MNYSRFFNASVIYTAYIQRAWSWLCRIGLYAADFYNRNCILNFWFHCLVFLINRVHSLANTVSNLLHWCLQITSYTTTYSCLSVQTCFINFTEKQNNQAQIHRYCLKIYPKMCDKIILRQKLCCHQIIL